VPISLAKNVIRFGVFELDPRSKELRKSGVRIKLQQKPLDLLLVLLEHPGEMLTRDELRRRLWPADVYVDFDRNLNTAVVKLRDALGDSTDSPRYVETLPRLGYRFIAPINGIVPGFHGDVTSKKESDYNSVTPTRNLRKPWVPGSSLKQYAMVSVTAFVILAALVVGLDLGGLRHRLWWKWSARSMPPPIESLAVIPFENLSGDPSKDYFADGFTDELITDLAEQTKIRVVSRSSVERYKGSRKSLPEMARELGVDAIVEGSVSLSDQKVRITAQLVAAPSDRHLWAHSYERDRKDLLPIQSEVAATVASLIRANTEAGRPGNVHSVFPHQRFTPETYELSLECRSLLASATEGGVNHAIECYQHILSLDPNCAAAYAQIARSYLALGLDNVPKARAAATKAVDLDPDLADAHLVLADYKAEYEWDLPGAETEFNQAITLNPSSATVRRDHATMLLATRRIAEAVAEARTAREIDPFSAGAALSLGMVLFMAGQSDRAIAEERAALQLDPDADRARYWLGYSLEQEGKYKDAIAEYQSEISSENHGVFLAALGRSLVLNGDFGKVADVRRKLERLSGKNFLWPYDAALFYAVLGDKDRAFEWLDKDLKQRDGWLLLLNVDPRLSPLRSDPRFQKLTRSVGLP